MVYQMQHSSVVIESSHTLEPMDVLAQMQLIMLRIEPCFQQPTYM